MTDTLTTPVAPADGSSRRDFLRRSAIVGGTLVWAAPTVQSVTPAAFAQTATKSPKDFSYLVLCIMCNGAECCVKFDLNDDGTVAEFTAGGGFAIPGCDDKYSVGSTGKNCASYDPATNSGDFTVTPINKAQTVQVTLLNTTNCTLEDAVAFGKCGNPPTNGECKAGTISGNSVTFDFCAGALATN